jgi:hypothetical protein
MIDKPKIINTIRTKQPYNGGEIEIVFDVERDNITATDGTKLYMGVLTIHDPEKRLQPLIQTMGDSKRHLKDCTSFYVKCSIVQDKIEDATYIVMHFLTKLKPLDL